MLVLGWAWLAVRKLNTLSKQTAIYYGDYRGVRNGLKWRVTKGWTEPGASRRKIFSLQSPICPLFPSYPFHPALHGAKECGYCLLPIEKDLSSFFFFFFLLLLVTWLFGCTQRWEKLSLSLVFQPCPEVLIGCLFYFPASGEELGSSPCLHSHFLFSAVPPSPFW